MATSGSLCNCAALTCVPWHYLSVTYLADRTPGTEPSPATGEVAGSAGKQRAPGVRSPASYPDLCHKGRWADVRDEKKRYNTTVGRRVEKVGEARACWASGDKPRGASCA